MTWKELKEILNAANVPDNAEVLWVDCYGAFEDIKVNIHYDSEDNTVYIS